MTKAKVSNDRPGVLIAILQSTRQPWVRIAFDGQRPTWIKSLPHEVGVLHLFGKSGPAAFNRYADAYENWRYKQHLWKPKLGFDRAIGRLLATYEPQSITGSLSANEICLGVDVPDSILTIPVKLLQAMRVFLSSPASKYLVITNTSSYIQSARLLDEIDKLPNSGVYAGPLINQGTFTFVSGAFRILSRDVVFSMLEERRSWDFGAIDDVAMGRLASRLGFMPVALPSLEIRNLDELNSLSQSLLTPIAHFRLKSYDAEGNRMDVALMRAIHQRLFADFVRLP